MSKIQIAANSGVILDCNAKTITGAKREASIWASYGAGDIFVLVNGDAVCTRRFWSDGGNFGWHKWENI